MPLSKQEKKGAKNEEKLCRQFERKYIKESKMLANAYKKRMKSVIESGMFSYQANLDFLYVYLQFLSDSIYLNNDEEEVTDVLEDITMAMNKYEDYLTCHEKYFEIKNGRPISKIGKSLEETNAECEAEVKKHLGEFCDMLKEHIFEWNFSFMIG